MSLGAHAAAARDGGNTKAWAVPVTDRAVLAFVSVLIFLPSFVFALSLRPIPALVVVTGCIGCLAIIIRRQSREDDVLDGPLQVERLLICLVLALVLFLLGGEGHLFHPPPDWFVRDAVLADLVRDGAAVGYDWHNIALVLRAPLGMYMLPALVGHVFGLFSAHLALLAQNTLFLGSILYLLLSIGRGWWHLAIMVAFSGASIVGALLDAVTSGKTDVAVWVERGLDAWHSLFQYSASLRQFFWVPNHALPGWWLATLLLIQNRAKLDTTLIGVSVAGLCFWSPLAVLPAVPWLAFAAATAWPPVFLARRTWVGLAASLCFLPIVAYLLLASGSLRHESPAKDDGFFLFYAVFIGVQLSVLIFIAAFWRHVPTRFRMILIINGLILLALPFFDFGVNNDLSMCASIAPLTIVAFVFGFVFIDLFDKNVAATVFGWLLLLLALPTPATELVRSIVKSRYPVSTCSLMEASHALGDKGIPTNYVVRAAEVPSWLMNVKSKPVIASERTVCWSGVDTGANHFPGFNRK